MKRALIPILALVLVAGAAALAARGPDEAASVGAGLDALAPGGVTARPDPQPRSERAGSASAPVEEPAPAAPESKPQQGKPAEPPVARPPSRAIGRPWRGRLQNGVRLPSVGEGYITWDPILERHPNRGWRVWGTDLLVDTIERVLAGYAADHPSAPRVVVGDLSRPRGGDFGRRFGAPGHASHQNGLDVDVYYPRLDRQERRPDRVSEVDRRLAQDLVDRFVAEGAQYVFVGFKVGLKGPKRVVQRIPLHEDHLHVRLYWR